MALSIGGKPYKKIPISKESSLNSGEFREISLEFILPGGRPAGSDLLPRCNTNKKQLQYVDQNVKLLETNKQTKVFSCEY